MDNFNKNDDLYDPNFSIDSSNTEKLDMYGVWVKKKKDALEPVDSDISQTISDTDLDKDDINFDDDFSFSDSFSNFDAESDEGKSENDEISSEMEPLEAVPSSSSDTDTSDTVLNADGFESLDLDDFFNEDDSSETEEKDDTDGFAEEEPIDLDFAEIADDPEKPVGETLDEVDAAPPAGLENFSEISLDEFEDAVPEAEDAGDTVETVEELDEFESVDDFDDILAADDAQNDEEIAEKPDALSDIDMNVTVDDDSAKVQPLTDVSSQVVENDSDISIFGSDEEAVDVSDGTQSDTPAFFDDIEAVKQDLLSAHQPAEQTDSVEQGTNVMNTPAMTSDNTAADQDKATELLMKIAHEISDIRTELSSLKAGLVGQVAGSSEASAKVDTHQEESAGGAESSGFFSDDDTDETIALTGDELNNILITADFTEERNVEEEPVQNQNDVSDDYEVPTVLTKEIVPEIGQHDATDDAAFEASIEEPASLDSGNDADAGTEGEKNLTSDAVFNVEPVPITSLPEDLSYLDDENVDADSAAEPMDGAESSDDAFALEDINIEEFDIPAEQDIALPQEDTSDALQEAALDPVDTEETPTIHELQKDDEFLNPFSDDSHGSDLEIQDAIVEEPFTGVQTDLESIAEEIPDVPSAESVEEIDDIPELEAEQEGTVHAQGSARQETLLQVATRKREQTVSIPLELKNEIKSVLAYMDQLLEALPEQKIEEFAKSEYFETYKHLFEELGISE